jgi:hypothetical protein
MGCTTRAWLRAWWHDETGMVVELESACKWWQQRWITIPRWMMKLICGLPELSVFAGYISSIIIAISHIFIWALF